MVTQMQKNICDSQAAVGVLNQTTITVALVKKCIDEMSKVGAKNQLKLVWLTDHCGMKIGRTTPGRLDH